MVGPHWHHHRHLCASGDACCSSLPDATAECPSGAASPADCCEHHHLHPGNRQDAAGNRLGVLALRSADGPCTICAFYAQAQVATALPPAVARAAFVGRLFPELLTAHAEWSFSFQARGPPC